MTKKPARKWRKSPDELIALFEAALPNDKRVERRKMFGYPSAFVGGHLFTGLHQESLVVRLGAEDRDAALELDGARSFEPMPGRTMRDYVVLPPQVLAQPAETTAWMRKALAHAASLPLKQRKPARKRPCW